MGDELSVSYDEFFSSTSASPEYCTPTFARPAPYTIFKPTYFMETLPRHIQGKRAVVLGRQPHPLAMIAATDFARMVSHAFRTPEAAHREFCVHGPEAMQRTSRAWERSSSESD